MLAAHANQNLILADIPLVEQWRVSKKGEDKNLWSHSTHKCCSPVLLIHQCPKDAILLQPCVFIHLIS